MDQRVACERYKNLNLMQTYWYNIYKRLKGKEEEIMGLPAISFNN